MSFGGDGSICFVKKTSRDYENEKPSLSLKKIFRQSELVTPEPVS